MDTYLGQSSIKTYGKEKLENIIKNEQFPSQIANNRKDSFPKKD